MGRPAPLSRARVHYRYGVYTLLFFFLYFLSAALVPNSSFPTALTFEPAGGGSPFVRHVGQNESVYVCVCIVAVNIYRVMIE